MGDARLTAETLGHRGLASASGYTKITDHRAIPESRLLSTLRAPRRPPRSPGARDRTGRRSFDRCRQERSRPPVLIAVFARKDQCRDTCSTPLSTLGCQKAVDPLFYRGLRGDGLLTLGVGVGSLKFLSDWSHEQNDDIRPGESLSIEYASERLRGCRASRYGRDAWSITAGMRFHPNGREQSGAVTAREQSGTVVAASLIVEIPVDATKIELWFQNTDNTGCVAWDSRYGQNYWLTSLQLRHCTATPRFSNGLA
jgi:hypothetical protein